MGYAAVGYAKDAYRDMLKKIITTIATRYAVVFLNLLLIFINAKVLGRHAMGLAGIIYASANLVYIFNSILCGNTIVYFMNRCHVRYVFWPAYVWALAGSALACGCLWFFGMLPAGYGGMVYALAVLMSLVATHARILLGADRVRAFNAVFLLQGGLLFFALLYLYYAVGWRSVSAYLTGLLLTNGVAWMVSLWMLVPLLMRGVGRGASSPPSVWKWVCRMVTYGLWSSVDNLAEGFVARLNYFLIERLGGYAQVGLLEAGTKVAESVWHVSRSVSFILYGEVAKNVGAEAQRRLTLQTFKATCCALLLMATAVCCVPERIYTDYLFASEFQGVRRVIQALAAGVVALGCNSIFSHYFIGTGKVRYSAACSCVGLFVLCIAGSILIPAGGIVGAALSTSVAFVSMLLFSLTVFMHHTRTSPKELLLTRSDCRLLLRRIRTICRREPEK